MTKGFISIGYLSNLNEYGQELKRLSGTERIDWDSLHDKVQTNWDHRYEGEGVICFDSSFAEVDCQSSNIRYIMINTELTEKDSKEYLYGGFTANSTAVDLSEGEKKWRGVVIGTKESIVEVWKEQNHRSSLEQYTFVYSSIYNSIVNTLEREYGINITVDECKRVINESFCQAEQNKKLGVCKQRGGDDQISYFSLNDDRIVDKKGKPFFIKMEPHKDRNKEGCHHKWFGLFLVSDEELKEELFELSIELNSNIGPMLFNSVDDANQFLSNLTKKAMKEKWYYWDNPPTYGNKYPILKSYLEHTYYHLCDEDRNASEEEKKIVEYNNEVFFNTGLLDRNFRQVFIVGKKGKYKTKLPALGEVEWDVIRDVKICDENSDEIASNFRKNELPKIAKYFNDCSDVVFDASLDIRLNDNHIFEDGVERNRLQKYKKAYDECKDDREERDRLITRIARDFDSAVERAKLMAERNYKLAVPQVWRETGEIQFLLPIYLGENEESENPQCALVLSLEDTGRVHYYRGFTILTLEMAYNNARLLAKPDVFWLNDITTVVD